MGRGTLGCGILTTAKPAPGADWFGFRGHGVSPYMIRGAFRRIHDGATADSFQ